MTYSLPLRMYMPGRRGALATEEEDEEEEDAREDDVDSAAMAWGVAAGAPLGGRRAPVGGRLEE